VQLGRLLLHLRHLGAERAQLVLLNFTETFYKCK
jgi:hypothetical protein